MRAHNLKFSAFAVVLATVSSSAVPTLALSYPIYYKCDANRQMTETLTGTELTAKLQPLLALPKTQQAAAISSLCQGLNQCQNQLSQILQATQVSNQVAEQLYEQELQKLSATSGAQPIDEASFDYRKQVLSTGFDVSACRNTIEDLPASSFEGNRGNLFIYDPHFNQYTYVTGCRPDPVWNCTDNSEAVLENAIRKAVVGGVDPYFVLAIGLMENGANGVGGLYLDPIGKETALGCTTHNADAATPGVLDSYSTYYKVDAGIVQNKDLSQRLSKAMLASLTAYSPVDNSTPSSSISSYYCQDTNGSASGTIQSNPGPNQCCIQVNVPAGSTNDSSATQRLVDGATGELLMGFLRQTQNSQLAGKTDPAYRLQHYNGFSQLMGGAEAVSVFRSGVNDYDTPTYGYQGMDFILNSLVSNPAIRNLVAKITKETGSTYPSILCEDVAVPGTYQIDSDNYYKKHRDSPRLQVIQGKAWSAMTRSEQKVMSRELADPPVMKQLQSHFSSLPSEITGTGMGLKVSFPNGSDMVVPLAQSSAIQSLPLAQGNLPETPASLAADVSSGTFPLDPEKAKAGLTITAQDGKTETISFQNGFQPQKWNEDGMPLTPAQESNMTVSYNNGATVLKYTNGEVSVIKGALNGDYIMGDEVVTLPDHTGFTIHSSCGSLECLDDSFGQGIKIGYSNGQSIKIQRGNLASLAPGSVVGPPPPTMDQVTAYYFKNIYPSRNTVGKASTVPWSDLTPDALQTMIKQFQTGNGSNSSSYLSGFGGYTSFYSNTSSTQTSTTPAATSDSGYPTTSLPSTPSIPPASQ